MDTTFAAMLDGKLVRYPMSATFVVERVKGPKKHRFLTHKSNLNSALARYHNAKDEKKGRVKLSALHDGTLQRLL